jgi:hypothetical protein
VLLEGEAAAYIAPGSTSEPNALNDHSNHFAFYFDRVLGAAYGDGGDEHAGDSESFFRAHGLAAYNARETSLAEVPAHPGPMAGFFSKVMKLRDHLKDTNSPNKIGMSVITARAGGGSVARVSTTLSAWNIEPDDLISCGATPKSPYLEKHLKADIFFDDGAHHIETVRHSMLAVFVPWAETQGKIDFRFDHQALSSRDVVSPSTLQDTLQLLPHKFVPLSLHDKGDAIELRQHLSSIRKSFRQVAFEECHNALGLSKEQFNAMTKGYVLRHKLPSHLGGTDSIDNLVFIDPKLHAEIQRRIDEIVKKIQRINRTYDRGKKSKGRNRYEALTAADPAIRVSRGQIFIDIPWPTGKVCSPQLITHITNRSQTHLRHG